MKNFITIGLIVLTGSFLCLGNAQAQTSQIACPPGQNYDNCTPCSCANGTIFKTPVFCYDNGVPGPAARHCCVTKTIRHCRGGFCGTSVAVGGYTGLCEGDSC